MKILIVGAGIGGLTLAAFLKDSNIEYDIVDKVSNWDKQGFSIGIWNNGRHILKKLGLADKFDTYSTPIRHYRICDGSGRVLKEYNLSKFYSEYGVGYNNINRNDIHTWLLDLVGKEKVRFGVSVDAIENQADGVCATFTTGNVQRYDLIVGADGIHSKVRDVVWGKNLEHFDNWRVWYAWIDNSAKRHATVTEYIEAGELVGIFDAGDKTTAVMMAPVDHAVWDDVRGRLGRIKSIFNEPTTEHFFDNLRDEDITPTDLSFVRVKHIVKGSTVLMGDAAHGFEPHAGLGASMAMEDGYVLAAELMRVSETYSLSNALRTYESQRKERVQIARSLTHRMRLWAFIKSKSVRRMVNLLIPLIPERFFVDAYNRLLREEI